MGGGMRNAAIAISIFAISLDCLIGLSRLPADETQPSQVNSDEKRDKPAVAEKIDFNRDIQPIFAKRCFACHGPDKGEGGLQLHEQKRALAELESALTPIETHEPAQKTRQTRGEGFTLRYMAIVLVAVVVTAALLGRAMVEPAPPLQRVDTPVAADPAPTPVSSPSADTVTPELQASGASGAEPQAATDEEGDARLPRLVQSFLFCDIDGGWLCHGLSFRPSSNAAATASLEHDQK
jgi:mono/diheme cytochrome c family protein